MLVMQVVDLGSNENGFSRYTRVSDTLADFRFIAIRLSPGTEVSMRRAEF
jgi:hypothetical protein